MPLQDLGRSRIHSACNALHSRSSPTTSTPVIVQDDRVTRSKKVALGAKASTTLRIMGAGGERQVTKGPCKNTSRSVAHVARRLRDVSQNVKTFHNAACGSNANSIFERRPHTRKFVVGWDFQHFAPVDLFRMRINAAMQILAYVIAWSERNCTGPKGICFIRSMGFLAIQLTHQELPRTKREFSCSRSVSLVSCLARGCQHEPKRPSR